MVIGVVFSDYANRPHPIDMEKTAKAPRSAQSPNSQIAATSPGTPVKKARKTPAKKASAAYTIAAEALGKALPLHAVNVTQPQPDYAGAYDEFFNCPVNFSAPANDFRFDESYLYEPLLQSETASARVFAAQCERICAELERGGSFAELIRQHLVQLPHQLASLETIAERLCTTPRTIQRKLASEDTSFKELVEDVRKNLSSLNQVIRVATSAPATPESSVVTAMAGTAASAASSEPGLNPNQPMRRMKQPMMAKGMLWPGMAFTEPSLLNLPMRGPTTLAPTSAAVPPTMWTTPEPAKST